MVNDDNVMSEEMMLRYFVYLTHMYAGTPKWKECYEAWNRFAIFMTSSYEEAIQEVTQFRQKYKVRSKKST